MTKPREPMRTVVRGEDQLARYDAGKALPDRELRGVAAPEKDVGRRAGFGQSAQEQRKGRRPDAAGDDRHARAAREVPGLKRVAEGT